MRHYLIFLLLLALQITQAQQPITFERIYSDSGVVEGRRIRQTFDGGYIIAGRRTPPSVFFGNDGTLMKTDSLGNVEWLKVFGTRLDDDWFDDVQQTADSGFIACGYLPEMGMAENIYIVKTDKDGDTVWIKTYGSNIGDIARSIAQTYDGGYLTTGLWQDTMGFVFRLDAQGDTLWTKYFYTQSGFFMHSIAETLDSGCVAVGVWGAYNLNLNNQVYIIRLDKNGNTIWEKHYGYSGPEEGRSVKVLPDGSFIVGGYSWQPPNNYDSYLLKLDANGDTLWTKLFSTPRENGIVELTMANKGNIVFGEMESTIAIQYQNNVTQTDSTGNLLWRREYGGINSEYIYGITTCSDSGFAFCSLSESFGILPVKYIVKTNENGLLTALMQIEDKKTVPIKVGPNPFEDIIYIDLTELLDKDYQAVLYDVRGVELINKTVQGGQNNLLSMDTNLPSAAYFLQIRDKDKIYVAIQLIRH